MDSTAFIILVFALLVAFILYWIFVRKHSVRKIAALQADNFSLLKETEFLKTSQLSQQQEMVGLKEELKTLISEKISLSAKLSVSENNVNNLQEKLKSQKEELNSLQEKFTADFKLIADSILRQNSEDFSASHQKELQEILNPLKEKIKVFEESIERKYVDETKERSSLKNELKQLLDLNKTLNLQAENLTSALKGENKTQGNWGEMVLERILETSGLIKGSEYDRQYSSINSENRRIQPDIVIKLPENKHIIIDAKVSLVAYEKYVSEADESFREAHLKSHILSVKNHIKQLSDKNYQTGVGLNTPDFVLLFMPIEPSFTLAARYDSGLFHYGWEKKVILVSPTTLLATLKTVASVWKNERKFKNAHEISSNAAKLYDKFKSFIDDMQKIEKGINSAQNAYKDAFSKLNTGKGNLISRAEKFKELGVSPTKSISPELTDPSLNEK